MSKYVLSPAAQLDLADIWDYTRTRWGPDQADAYIREIQRAIERIVGNPLIGRNCEHLRAGYRRHAVGSHLLYYRPTADNLIDVVRILHKRMDVDNHLD